MRNIRVLTGGFLAAMIAGAGVARAAPAPAATDAGLAIAAGLERPLVLSWPVLRVGAGETKPERVELDGDSSAVLHYAGGAQATVAIKADGVTFHFVKLPADAKGLTCRMAVPLAAIGKLQWSYDGSAPTNLPAQAGKDQFVCKGTAKRFALFGADGAGFALHIPHGWQQFTDLRVWKTDRFEWMTSTEMPRSGAGEAYYTLYVTTPDGKIQPSAKPATPKPAAAKPAPSAVRTGIYLGDKGLRLVRNALAGYTLSLPALQGAAPQSATVTDNGRHAALKYANGATARLTLDDAGDLSMVFANLPAGPANVRMEMQIGFDHVHGGKYEVGDGPQDFPKETRKGHMYAGAATRFGLTHPQGGSYALTFPSGTYQQLDDCRQWNDWHVFKWFCQMPLAAGGGTLKLQVRDLGGAPDAGKPLVDEFGQSTQSDWPGKVKSEAELKADAEDEKAYYARFETLPTDEYGGLAGSGAKLGLKATGFFHVQKAGGRWYLVDPAGNAFFHLGLCSFGGNTYTYVEGRREIYAWLPPTGGTYESAFNQNSYWHDNAFSFHLANQIRKYGAPADPETLAARMIERVRRLGFNSSGAFSGSPTDAQRAAKFPHMGGIGGDEIPGLQRVWDPFDEKTRQKIVAGFEKNGEARRNDPLMIGYFLGNEPLFEDVPRVVPTLKGKVAAKRALVDLLRQRHATIEAFNAAWETKAASFDELNDMPLAVRTRAASQDMDAYQELFLETFFKFSHDTIRKYDPNHLIVGCRLQAGTASSEKVCRISGKYLDVFSLNYYTYGFDADFLAKVQQWSGGLPMMFTEFFFDSPSDSGLGGGFKEVASQEQRGLAYRHYVEHAAALPFVVGIEWYVMTDNPVTGLWYGRYGGLRDNNGIFSVVDRPWKPLVEAMAETNRRVYDLMSGAEKPFVFDDFRFTGGAAKTRRTLGIARSAGPIKVDGTAGGYPGLPPEQITSQRLVDGMSADGLAANYRICWDDTHLYLLVDVADATPMRSSKTGDDLWQGDGVELFIGSEELDRPGAVIFSDRHVLFGAAQVNDKWQWFFDQSAQQPEVEMIVVPRTGDDGYILEAAIPFTALGFTPKLQQVLLFDLAISDSADGLKRKSQLMWNGATGNSRNRTAWGRAKLVE